LAKKEDLQPILEWLESLQMAKKLAGELWLIFGGIKINMDIV
jgi:hypothetical protein